MLTVITGTPGAGKTLYAITKLLLPLVGTKVKAKDADGNDVEHPRVIYTNINGLLIDHELVQFDSELGVHNWHKWAKPGAVIVVDEFQKLWPPRPNGSKVPDDVQALDTHRHMGVDFILITQNVMNCDRHIHGLTNRHLHVRRMANMPLAIVYEWDHCSRTLMFSKAITKHPWRYDKKVFKLYHSADAHTKQPRSLPGLVWFILVAAIGLVVLGPTAKARLSERIGGPAKAASAAGKPQPFPSAVGALAAVPAASAAMSGASAVASIAPAVQKGPELAGCGMAGTRCKCFDREGSPLEVELQVCLDKVGADRPAAVIPDSLSEDPLAAAARTRAAELELLEFAAKSRRDTVFVVPSTAPAAHGYNPDRGGMPVQSVFKR